EPVLRGRLPTARRPGGTGRRRATSGARLGRGRRPCRPRPGQGVRMPLLARTVMTPLTIEVSRGAIGRLDTVIGDSRISGRGRVAVALGAGIGPLVTETVAKTLPTADLLTIESGTYDAAMALAERLKAHEYDAVVGVGGGKIIDTVKYAASQRGMSMVAVATS